MYTPSVQSIAQVILAYEMHGVSLMNVWHYKNLSEFSSGNFTDGKEALENLLSAIDVDPDGLTDALETYLSDQVTFKYLQAQWIDPTRYAYIRALPVKTAGTVAGDAAPQNVAVSVTLKTDNAGRHAVGRTQFAGVAAAAVDDGSVNPAVKGGLQTIVTDILMGPYTIGDPAESFGLCILNRGAPGQSILVTDAIAQDSVRVMRRRTVGLGI